MAVVDESFAWYKKQLLLLLLLLMWLLCEIVCMIGGGGDDWSGIGGVFLPFLCVCLSRRLQFTAGGRRVYWYFAADVAAAAACLSVRRVLDCRSVSSFLFLLMKF